MADRPDDNASEEYQGLPGLTRQEAIHYTCGECGRLFGAAVHTAINVSTDPELGEQLSRGELNALTCPACGAAALPNIPLIYHDPKAARFALLLPEGARHLELQERARVLQSLTDDPADIPDYVRRVDVVFGTAGLLALLDETMEALTPKDHEAEHERIRAALDERQTELERKEEEILAREEDIQAKQEDVLARNEKLDRKSTRLNSSHYS